MTDDVGNLVLEHLRAVRREVSELRLDMGEVKSRMTAVAMQPATLNERIDRVDERFARIELRLELADA